MASSNTFVMHQGESTLQVDLALAPNLRQQFGGAPRSYSYTGSRPANWKLSYFQMFLTHAADRGPVQALLAALRTAVQPQHNDGLLEAATAFVQTAIAYDWQAADQISGGKIHYPSETLVDRKGVCADKTILLAALLQALGYRLAIFTWERANHMALGVAVPAGQGNFGSAYAMIETTGATAIGIVPDRYAGGIKLDGKPEIVELGGQQAYQGIAQLRKNEQAQAAAYGPEYLKMPAAQQVIHRKMHPLKAEIEALSQQLKACKGTLQPAQYAACQQLNAQHNAKVAEYNALVVEFNGAK